MSVRLRTKRLWVQIPFLSSLVSKFPPVIFNLNLIDSKSILLSFGSSLWYFHKLLHIFNNYELILWDYILKLLHQEHWLIYLCIFYFIYLISSLWSILNYYLLIFSYCNFTHTSYCYSLFCKFLCITVIADSWLQHCCFKLDLVIHLIIFMCLTIHSVPFLLWIWMVD